METRKLHLSERDRKLGGVCGGLGDLLGVDGNLIRILTVVLAFMTGLVPVVVTYLVAWVLLPQASDLPVRVPMGGEGGETGY